ncbi:SCO family protein [Marinobacter fonticola]|uniref:SCO family protein n=1 Tax=Marinobacter fonticola TaxID=2603215 RepID=UPI0011E85E86|nr:SCO family protein [Marinobacter fonticola]
MTRITWTLGWLLILMAAQSHAHSEHEAKTAEQRLEQVAFDQRIGETLPGDITFLDRTGAPVQIGQLAQGKPMVLVMSWFDCPNLCPMLLGRLAETAEKLSFAPDEYQVVAVSIDPGEGPEEAQAVERRMRSRNGDIAANWRFLSGDHAAIDRLAEAVGFDYVYDAEHDRYAHPAGLVIVDPDGTINRYLFGIDPQAPDLRLALLDAGKGEVGSPVDQVVLRCYRFNVESGQYNLAVMRLLQASGGIFMVAVVVLFFWMRRRNRL